jgi:hypothetical protein
MKTTILALLVSVLGGCGDGLTVPGDADECRQVGVTAYECRAESCNPCLFGLPAGVACSDVVVYADGVRLPEGNYDVVCNSGSLVVPNCQGKGIAVAAGSCSE